MAKQTVIKVKKKTITVGKKPGNQKGNNGRCTECGRFLGKKGGK